MQAIISSDTEQLKTLEYRANEWRKVSIHGWMQFCIVALEIKDSGLYKQVSKTWGEYILKTWGIKDASKIRKDKMVLPYADILIKALPEITLEKTDLLPLHTIMRERGGANNPLMVSTYVLGQQVASNIGKKPTASHYRHCLAVLEENEVTNGNITYGGGHVSSAITGALELSVLERIDEAQKRHIARLQPRQKVTVDLNLIKDESGRFRLALPEHIPAWLAGKQVTFYIDKDDDNGT